MKYTEEFVKKLVERLEWSELRAAFYDYESQFYQSALARLKKRIAKSKKTGTSALLKFPAGGTKIRFFSKKGRKA